MICSHQHLVTNARKGARGHANPLRYDPTRTGLIRRAFMAETSRRLAAVRKALWNLVVVQDSFGLKPRAPGLPALNEPYQFLTDAKKLDAFNSWFQRQLDLHLLTVPQGENPWTSKYVQSAYKKAAVDAYARVNKSALAKSPDWYQGGQQQFLKDAFYSPEAVDKIKLLATRSFEDMKGVTTGMKSQMNRILADGMAHGKGPGEVAREMVDSLDMTAGRAMTIARTEIIHAHAEGTLDSFDALGIDQVGAQVEFSTAGDDRVCPECEGLEGQVYSTDDARGVIPVHPNCRCVWLPYLGNGK